MTASERAPAGHYALRPSVGRVMGMVLLALLPGAVAQTYVLGFNLAWQLLIAVAFGVGFEALMLTIRGRQLRPFLGEMSAPLAAVLLALLLPVPTPWWMLAAGTFVALGLAKHAFGGLGNNLFNPAMAGYGVLLVVFPDHFARTGIEGPGQAPAGIALLYALGGIFLVAKKIIPWQTPAAMLSAAVLAGLCFSVASPMAADPDLSSMVSASWVLAAFFIVTDPVTGCLSTRGRMCFGAGVGLLAVVLSRAGGVADGLPFAVLLMNCAAPWLDSHTRPVRSRASAQP